MEAFSDLVVFTEVVTKKSFTTAGKALQMSTSAVSKHIARLESELNVKLLQRTTHNVIPTEAGAVFYEHCARILGMLALARTETTGLTGEMKGTLRVHTTPGVGLNLVVPAAIEFAQTHASVTVDLTVGELPLDLTNKRLDLVIASRHFGEDDPKVYSTMASRNLGAMPYVICASPNYLLRHGTPETPRQLAEHRCLVHVTQKRNPQDWSFGPKEIRYVVRVKEAFRSNIESAILMAALQGAGIARLPEYIARRDLNAGNLRVLFPGAVHSGRLVKAFFPRSKHIPRKVRLFIDLVDKRYEKSSIDS